MSYRAQLRRIVDRAALPMFVLLNGRKPRYSCPVCGYTGPFADVAASTGLRQHAMCPRCRALERHRLQYLVLLQLLTGRDCGAQRILHVAPEPFFRPLLASTFGQYETADLEAADVDHRVDLQDLPFRDACYDVVFASHVLEHVPDDRRAIAEIRRILRPGGIAILPVPLVAERTIDYPAPNPAEFGHVRAPGLDYFDRYEREFTRVERISSEAFPDIHQLHVHEDRTRWPTPECPLRTPMMGVRHVDVVPVCYS